jgi:hypothetical protein
MHDVLQTDLFPKARLSLDALSVFSEATAEEREPDAPRRQWSLIE